MEKKGIELVTWSEEATISQLEKVTLGRRGYGKPPKSMKQGKNMIKHVLEKLMQ